MVSAILEKIRKMRLEKNLSQKYLAYRLNITQSSYAKIERGEIKLRVHDLITIADCFEVNPATFFNTCRHESGFNKVNIDGLEKKIQKVIIRNINANLIEIKEMIIEIQQKDTISKNLG